MIIKSRQRVFRMKAHLNVKYCLQKWWPIYWSQEMTNHYKKHSMSVLLYWPSIFGSKMVNKIINSWNLHMNRYWPNFYRAGPLSNYSSSRKFFHRVLNWDGRSAHTSSSAFQRKMKLDKLERSTNACKLLKSCIVCLKRLRNNRLCHRKHLSKWLSQCQKSWELEFNGQ